MKCFPFDCWQQLHILLIGFWVEQRIFTRAEFEPTTSGFEALHGEVSIYYIWFAVTPCVYLLATCHLPGRVCS